MKKILLCLFLLMSFSFYSQVPDMTHCAGDTTFNLTYHNSLLIGNLNPAETTVSYHLTPTDASNGANAISNPTNFIVPQSQGNILASQTIYARINHLGNITTNYFSLIVNPDFHSAARIEPIDCYSNGTIMLDIFGGQAPFDFFINGSHSTDNILLYGPVSTLRIPNLVAGTYNIEIRDAIGCLTFGSWTIEPSSIIPLDTPTAAVLNATCKGGNNGAININATGGKAPLSYSIDNGANYVLNNTFTNLVSGNYAVYVKDDNGCIKSTSVSVTEPNLLQMTAAITKPIDCVSNATATLTATGGTAPYTYSKDGSTFEQNNVFDNLAAGTYTIFVKDANGCISQNSTVISSLVSINATIAKIDAHCKGNSDGSITVAATGGQAPYTYSLDNGTTFVSSTIFTGLATGTYNIIVKDALSCTTTMTTTISDPDLLSIATAITKPIDCISNAVVTVTVTGGTAPYTYSKDGSTFEQNNVFDNLAAGTYTIFVKDANGCISQNSTVISSLVSINATIAKINARCKGDRNGSITVNATGGQAPYFYSFDNGVTYVSSNVFTGLAIGTYNVIAKDALNCTSSMTTTIGEPTLLLMTAAITKPLDCISNAIVTLTATGGTAPYTYSKDGITFVQSNVIDNLVAGTYTTYVKDANGCVNQNPIDISPLTSLSTTIAKTDASCKGDRNGSITVNATGGQAPYFYSFDNGVTYVSSNVFTGLAIGTYNIIVKDANNCTSSMIATIVEPALLSMTAAITKPLDCINNAIVTLTATGGTAPYTYSKDGITFVQSNVIDNLVAGTYITYVKDANGCVNQNTTVISPLIPISALITKTDVLCKGNNDGSIIINTMGGQDPYFYSLDNGLTYVSSNFFNNLSARAYNVSVKDALGCIHTMVSTILEPTILSITAVTTNSTTSAENDGTITVNAMGGVAPYSYTITSNGGLPAIPFQTSNIFTGLTAGSYDVYVKDVNGCIYFQTNIIAANNPNSLVVSAVIMSITCANPTGTISINATGGTAPYQYSLDNGANYYASNVFTGLTPGNYTIKVRDYQNTTFSITAIITQGSVPVINITATNINCKGETSGSITANVTGGLAPYTYSLDNGPYINGNSSMTFTNLYADTHNITVKDTNGCLTTTQVVITEPASALMTVTTVKNQTITINASGGTGNYRYAISPNLDNFSTNNVFSGLTPRSYIVNTSDVNGCYITMNALVDPPAPLINGQIKLTLEFKLGQTLADLIIDGQNIKWYINQNPLAGKTSRTSEIPLPLTTVIVEGTTYYASQTINGIESTERMAVTVKSSTLGTNDLVIKNFEYYPNPVKNVLTISNTSIIDEVTFISIKGETLLTKKINGLRSEIDLSNFSNGVYFLKVKTEGTEKTVKLIKE
jgi:guanyl-specific ribonuclease Sa